MRRCVKYIPNKDSRCGNIYRRVLAYCFLLLLWFLAMGQPAAANDFRQRLPQDEVIYFLLPDRFANGDTGNDNGGLQGGPLRTGFDPTHKGFYHGGDLKGLVTRLDYIQTLGASAIWLGPIYRNKPVQGRPGHESAGYHGYWIVDFTDIDSHFGTRADFKAFVQAAHARGIKVYLDIITNHTADIIRYRECVQSPCAYRGLGEYPYARRGGLSGESINPGFSGDEREQQTPENFAKLIHDDYAYTPFVPSAERAIKKPAWLNDPRYYHNRGDSLWFGESVNYGDFSGLDDLFTENPRVVQGFIDIYGQWIDDFGIDGFRIDTAKHVNPEFWQAFVPAMQERAKRKGIPNFHIFGEVYDPDAGMLARFTHVDHYPSVLDFAFQSAVAEAIAGKAGTEKLARLFSFDALYAGGEQTALQLPTFLGNHDMGRFAYFVRKARPHASDAEVLQRTIMGHALLFFARGVPVIYYGDEQGFAGDGGDQDARQDMFASRVDSYNDDRLVGSQRSTAQENFKTNGPLFEAIARMARIRHTHPALRRGVLRVRHLEQTPGVFAFSRLLEDEEILVAINTGDAPSKVTVPVRSTSMRWEELWNQCPAQSAAPGSITLELAPLAISVCRAVGGSGRVIKAR